MSTSMRVCPACYSMMKFTTGGWLCYKCGCTMDFDNKDDSFTTFIPRAKTYIPENHPWYAPYAVYPKQDGEVGDDYPSAKWGDNTNQIQHILHNTEKLYWWNDDKECAAYKKYLKYLIDWAHSHDGVGFVGMTPACFDEYVDCELRQEEEHAAELTDDVPDDDDGELEAYKIYLEYLAEWILSHDCDSSVGMSPLSFDDWVDREIAKEHEKWAWHL